jgi:transcriptional regulator with XRE-family HTH domain
VPRLTASERRVRQKLAANARQLREEGGLTLEEVANRAGIHWRHWQKIESGEVNLTLASLARVADALQVEPARLLSSAHRCYAPKALGPPTPQGV